MIATVKCYSRKSRAAYSLRSRGNATESWAMVNVEKEDGIVRITRILQERYKCNAYDTK